jgi:hypothetical protein
MVERISPGSELLPCPFCGGPAVNVADEYITCGAAWNNECPAHKIRCLPYTWNARANPPVSHGAAEPHATTTDAKCSGSTSVSKTDRDGSIPSASATSPDEAAEVQDTYLVGGPDLKAMSGSVESDRVIQLHFSRKATDADRAWLLEAINAKKAADKAGVGDVAQPTWQPFETAPKDGTPILCFHPDDVFQPITGIDLIWWEISENFWTQDGDSPIPFVAKPTHWRPLPTPPVSSTEGNTP